MHSILTCWGPESYKLSACGITQPTNKVSYCKAAFLPLCLTYEAYQHALAGEVSATYLLIIHNGCICMKLDISFLPITQLCHYISTYMDSKMTVGRTYIEFCKYEVL